MKGVVNVLSRAEILKILDDNDKERQERQMEILDIARKTDDSDLRDTIERLTQVQERMAEDSRIRKSDMKLLDQLMDGRYRFDRPSRGLAGFISTLLGPLPGKIQVLDASRENLARVKRYNLLGPAILGVIVSILILLATLFPWMAWSPLRAIYSQTETMVGVYPAIIISVVAFYYLSKLLAKGIDSDAVKGSWLARLASYEEQWFRAGAENWTWGQRAYSCLAFGSIHIINVFYPVWSILALSVAGACFLAVYLKEYRRSGSTELATLASTQVNLRYNQAALVLIVVAVAYLVLSSIG